MHARKDHLDRDVARGLRVRWRDHRRRHSLMAFAVDKIRDSELG
jgi:hypothetical protein